MYPTLNLPRLAAVLVVTGIFLSGALTFPEPWHWPALVLTVASGAAGTAALVEPPLWEWPVESAVTHVALPSLLLFAAALALHSYPIAPAALMVLGGVLALLVFGALVVGKNLVLTRKAAIASPAGELLNIAAYLTAFLLFVALYRLAPPLVVKIPVIALIGALLTLELLSHVETTASQSLMLSGVVGLTLAETALSLHLWPQEGAFTAMFLLLGFYLITGILQSHFRHRLTSLVVLEFLSVGVVSFGFLFVFQAWRLG